MSDSPKPQNDASPGQEDGISPDQDGGIGPGQDDGISLDQDGTASPDQGPDEGVIIRYDRWGRPRPPRRAGKAKLSIIGFGPGDIELLTGQARQAFDDADVVLSTSRISQADPRIQAHKLDQLERVIEGLRTDTLVFRVAVLVSGDSGYYSLARTLVERFSEAFDIELLPGISSIQYLSALIQKPYDDALLVSLHGRERNERIVPKVAYNAKVFALTGADNRAEHMCFHLDRLGLGGVQVTVGERLSYPDQRITTGTASELHELEFDDLSVAYFENPAPADPFPPLGDDDFTRGEVPMTKAEVRWLSLAKMRIRPTDVIYDIGAGTGSVAIEAARRAHDGLVYAIEKEDTACELIATNIRRHGAYNCELVRGEAPDAFKMLPIPDTAFIGGSSGNIDPIIRRLTALNPEIRIVINAVTVQTLSEATRILNRSSFKDFEVVCLNISRSRQVGRYDMLIAQNPIYIISATAIDEVKEGPLPAAGAEAADEADGSAGSTAEEAALAAAALEADATGQRPAAQRRWPLSSRRLRRLIVRAESEQENGPDA